MKKKLLLAGFLGAVSVLCMGVLMNVIILPTSQWPIRSTIKPFDRTLMLDTNNLNPQFTNYTVAFNDIVQNIATNNTFLTVLFTNPTFVSNFVFYATNSSTINNFITTINPEAEFNGVVLVPTQATNYILDWGTTNNFGQTNIYGTIDATANVNITGFAHGFMWGLFSVNIIADGGNRVVWFPANWWNPPNADLSTNNLTADGATYRITLMNGNELRLTVQSNAPPPCVTSNHLSVIWTTFGQ